MRVLAVYVAAALLVASCAAAPRAIASSPPPTVAVTTPTPAPTASPTQSLSPALRHVFVIVMENASLPAALRAPSITTLASTYALAANYRSVGSPSLPNYLALTSGSTYGIVDDSYHPLPAGGIGAQLTAAGVSWRAYMEGLTGAGCMRSPYPYALKHNPFAYYGGACPDNVVSLDALDADLAGETPRFVWVTPGLCHDGHDCAIDVAGAWLLALVAKIVATPAWRDNGVLFIVWDEGNGASNVIPLIVATPTLAGIRSDTAYDHYSLLAAIEDVFEVPRLGAARDADPLTDLLPRPTR